MFYGKLISLNAYGNGWMWTLKTETGERTYRTNGDGEGLFYVPSDGRPAIQDRGTCQWSLSRYGAVARRQIIKKLLIGNRELEPGGPEHLRILLRDAECDLEFDSYSPSADAGQLASSRERIAALKFQLATASAATHQ